MCYTYSVKTVKMHNFQEIFFFEINFEYIEALRNFVVKSVLIIAVSMSAALDKKTEGFLFFFSPESFTAFSDFFFQNNFEYKESYMKF